MISSIYKHVLIVIGITLLSWGCTPSETKETSTKKHRYFTCRGHQLIDTNGNNIQLRGTNLGNWLVPEGYMFKTGDVNSPSKIDELLRQMIGPQHTDIFWSKHLENYIRKEDITYLKQTGVNHLRLPFHYKLFTNQNYLGTQNKGFHFLDKVISWCKEEGLYVLLDMHCAPGGQTGDNIDDSYGYPYLFTDSTAQEQLYSIWAQIAHHYKDNNTVIGYDIVNEPIAHYFKDDQELLEKSMINMYGTSIDRIRQHDKNHLIFLNGSMWSTNFKVFNKPFEDSLIVYEFHKYWMPPVQQEIQDYVDFRDRFDVPIYVGETGENKDEWVMKFRKLLDSNAVNWCFWPYKKMNNPKGIMNFAQPEVYQCIVDYSQADRSSYKAIRENRPQADSVHQALDAYLENSLFENCYPNKGYCEGLGLKP